MSSQYHIQKEFLPVVKGYSPKYMNAVTLFNGEKFGSSVAELKGKTGKVLGARLTYAAKANCGKSAKQIKEELKAANPDLKGRKLTEKVDEVLRGELDIRWATHDAATSALRSAGMVPDVTDVKKNGAVTRFVLPGVGESEEMKKAKAMVTLGLAKDEAFASGSQW